MPEVFRILLIEDNPGDVRLLEEYLPRSLPFAVDITVSRSLQHALRTLAAQEPFQLVLLDLFLKDSRGLPTLQAVQAVAAGMPVAVLSGNEDQEQRQAALSAGVVDYLTKANLDSRRLVLLLRRLASSGPLGAGDAPDDLAASSDSLVVPP